jgi:predicted ATPase
LAAGEPLGTPPTSFVGRERETAEIARLLTGGSRLVTLTGPAGVGKTRLALETAGGLAHHFTHGIARVSLAPVRDPLLVPSALAGVLEVPERQGQSHLEGVKQALRDREALLVLDNFEQVLPAGPLLVDLLSACQSVRLLVTSRIVLRVSGEHEFVVSPLRLPGPQTEASSSLAELARIEAVQLFVDRARAVRPEFAL